LKPRRWRRVDVDSETSDWTGRWLEEEEEEEEEVALQILEPATRST